MKVVAKRHKPNRPRAIRCYQWCPRVSVGRCCGDAHLRSLSAEICEHRAISFQLVVGGSCNVLMDTTICNGCGECISICPANAISINQLAS